VQLQVAVYPLVEKTCPSSHVGSARHLEDVKLDLETGMVDVKWLGKYDPAVAPSDTSPNTLKRERPSNRWLLGGRDTGWEDVKLNSVGKRTRSPHNSLEDIAWAPAPHLEV
jgi:hypothetical protein